MQHKRIKKKKRGKTFIKNKKNGGILLSSCAKGSMLCNILISSFWLFFFKTVSRVKSRSSFSERVCENIFDLLESHPRTQRRRSRTSPPNRLMPRLNLILKSKISKWTLKALKEIRAFAFLVKDSKSCQVGFSYKSSAATDFEICEPLCHFFPFFPLNVLLSVVVSLSLDAPPWRLK